MVKNALEPEWEAKSEPCSYGFRPGRSCHDAISRIFSIALPHSKKHWVVDADIRGAFDNISHETLLTMLDGFPAKNLVKQWLQAGIMDQGVFAKTEMGTPQGGVISPLLLNIALHGMEQAVGVVYYQRGSYTAIKRSSSLNPLCGRLRNLRRNTRRCTSRPKHHSRLAEGARTGTLERENQNTPPQRRIRLLGIQHSDFIPNG